MALGGRPGRVLRPHQLHGLGDGRETPGRSLRAARAGGHCLGPWRQHRHVQPHRLRRWRVHCGMRRRSGGRRAPLSRLPRAARVCVLPLVVDLANPSGRMGWNHEERQSLLDRGPADLVMALRLVHHLSLTNQVPFEMVAEFLHRAEPARFIVEFVPGPIRRSRRCWRECRRSGHALHRRRSNRRSPHGSRRSTQQLNRRLRSGVFS